MDMSVLLRSARLPYLVLTPICVFLGAAVVLSQGQQISWWLLGLAMLGGLLAHISVNTLNEYLDFENGLDLNTQRTPFSGGSGSLPENPQRKQSVLYLGVLSLLLCASIGFYFTWLRGLAILPLGLIGLLLVVFYTRWVNRRPWLCLFASGLGFGLLMVVGTQFVLSGYYQWQSVLVGLIPFFLVNNLLLLNQYPDVQADAAVGRFHFPIAYGAAASNKAYASMLLMASLLLIVLVFLGLLPNWGWLLLLALVPATVAWFGARKYGFSIGRQPQFLAMNVITSLLAPLVIALAMVFG